MAVRSPAKLKRAGVVLVAVLLVASLGGCVGWFTALLTKDGNSLNGIACPTATTCIAVGTTASGAALVMRTTDAGSSWHQVNTGVSGSGLNAVACEGATACVAGGAAGTVLQTADGGSTWTIDAPDATGRGDFTSIACPSATQCFAVSNGGSGGTLEESSDGGTTWQTSTWQAPQVEGESDAGLASISCIDADHCVAVGHLTVDLYPTTTVGTPDPGTIVTQPYYGSLFASTEDGGETWTSQYFQAEGGLSGVSCVAPSTCVAVGSYLQFVSTDGGMTWKQGSETSGEGVPSGFISCSDALHCLAVDGGGAGGRYPGNVSASSDGGLSWYLQSTSDNAASLAAVACASVSVCFAVGSTGSGEVILHTISGGSPSPMVTGVVPSSGYESGGMQVTINGGGFQYGVTGVFFGSATASSVQVISSTELTATVPVSPVSVPENSSGAPIDVTVQTQLGVSPLDPRDYFTYLPALEGCQAPVVVGSLSSVTCTPGNGYQTWIVPEGVTQIAIAADGGQGGPNALGAPGGLGGQASGLLVVTQGEQFTLFVGDKGGPNGLQNGGGQGPAFGGQGGDGSFVYDSSRNLLLAAGGGGGTSMSAGGSGGGLMGGNVSGCGGGGGTQSSGGSAGTGVSAGGNSAIGGDGPAGPLAGSVVLGDGGIAVGGGGDGGSGYFGGGGGGPGCGGGGGSGFVSPAMPLGALTSGVVSGPGSIVISYVSGS